MLLGNLESRMGRGIEVLLRTELSRMQEGEEMCKLR